MLQVFLKVLPGGYGLVKYFEYEIFQFFVYSINADEMTIEYFLFVCLLLVVPLNPNHSFHRQALNLLLYQ